MAKAAKKNKKKVKKTSTSTQARCTAEKFIEVWQTSSSADDVAKKLGLKLASVKAKAASYRRRDIELKKFPSKRGAKPLDIKALAKHALAYAPKSTSNGKRASA